jgi:hypothetical protein
VRESFEGARANRPPPIRAPKPISQPVQIGDLSFLPVLFISYSITDQFGPYALLWLALVQGGSCAGQVGPRHADSAEGKPPRLLARHQDRRL